MRLFRQKKITFGKLHIVIFVLIFLWLFGFFYIIHFIDYNYGYAFRLISAIEDENIEQLNKILKSRGNINSTIFPISMAVVELANSTPLLDACDVGNPEIIRILLEHGADPKKRKEKDSWFPLMQVLVRNHKQKDVMVKLLVDYGADVNASSDGRYPIIEAVDSPKYNEQYNVVKILLEHGADRTVVNKRGKTAMDYAVKNNLVEIIELLKTY